MQAVLWTLTWGHKDHQRSVWSCPAANVWLEEVSTRKPARVINHHWSSLFGKVDLLCVIYIQGPFETKECQDLHAEIREFFVSAHETWQNDITIYYNYHPGCFLGQRLLDASSYAFSFLMEATQWRCFGMMFWECFLHIRFHVWRQCGDRSPPGTLFPCVFGHQDGGLPLQVDS